MASTAGTSCIRDEPPPPGLKLPCKTDNEARNADTQPILGDQYDELAAKHSAEHRQLGVPARQRMEAQDDEISNLRASNLQLAEALRSAEGCKADLQKEKDQLEEQVTGQTRTISLQASEIDAVQGGIDSIEAALAAEIEKKESAAAQVCILFKEVYDLNEAVDSKNELVAKLEDDGRALKRKNDDLNEAVKILRIVLAAVSNKPEERTKSNDAQVRDIAGPTNQHDQGSLAINTLNVQQTDEITQHDGTRCRSCPELYDKLAKSDNKFNRAEAMRRKAAARVSELVRELEKCKTARDQSEARVTYLNNELGKAQEIHKYHVDTEAEEIGELRRKLGEKSETLDTKRKQDVHGQALSDKRHCVPR